MEMVYDIWTSTEGNSGETTSGSSAGATFTNFDFNEGISEFYADPCEVPYMASRRWYLVAVLGTSLSVVSLFSNVLIARVLLRPEHSNFLFLGLLALSDSFLSFCYGPVIAMDIIKNRLQILWVTRLWWGYVGPLLAMCHVSMTFSTFMIILGTIERYLITVKSTLLLCFRRNRSNAVVTMLLLALILRGTAIFEIKIVKTANGTCAGLTEYEPILTPLVDEWFYKTVFRFYIRTIATVFIPFFLLGYLNFRIVDTLRRQKRSAAMFRFATSDHKTKIRSATRLLVLIVCSYLLANCLNVFITAWEYVDLESTQTEFTYDIYETLTDIISMLYILTCAIRFPLYILFNQEIRNAIRNFLFQSSNRSAVYNTLVYRHSTATKRYLHSLADESEYGTTEPLDGASRSDELSPPTQLRNNSTGKRKKRRVSLLKSYCISCFCFCCADDEQYMYDRTASVSDLASHRAEHRSSSTRRLSLSNCAPMGTDFDRFVVAMALAHRFQADDPNQAAYDRGRRCTLPPNMLLNRCSNGSVTGSHIYNKYNGNNHILISETKSARMANAPPLLEEECAEDLDDDDDLHASELFKYKENLTCVEEDFHQSVVIRNSAIQRPTNLFSSRSDALQKFHENNAQKIGERSPIVENMEEKADERTSAYEGAANGIRHVSQFTKPYEDIRLSIGDETAQRYMHVVPRNTPQYDCGDDDDDEEKVFISKAQNHLYSCSNRIETENTKAKQNGENEDSKIIIFENPLARV